MLDKYNYKFKLTKENLFVALKLSALSISLSLVSCMSEPKPSNTSKAHNVASTNRVEKVTPTKETTQITPMSESQRSRIIRARQEAVSLGVPEKYTNFIGNWSDKTSHIQVVSANNIRSVTFIYKNSESDEIEILTPSDISTASDTILFARSLQNPNKTITLIFNPQNNPKTPLLSIKIGDGNPDRTHLEESGNTNTLSIAANSTQKRKLARVGSVPLFNTEVE
jgi:hypothetical protein